MSTQISTGQLTLGLLLLCTPALLQAADPADPLKPIAQQLTRAEQLSESVTSQREWNRDGLNTRVDQLLIRALRQLNVVGRKRLEETGTLLTPGESEPVQPSLANTERSTESTAAGDRNTDRADSP